MQAKILLDRIRKEWTVRLTETDKESPDVRSLLHLLSTVETELDADELAKGKLIEVALHGGEKVLAIPNGDIWCIYQSKEYGRPWRLLHRPTGLWTGSLKSKRFAVLLLKELATIPVIEGMKSIDQKVLYDAMPESSLLWLREYQNSNNQTGRPVPFADYQEAVAMIKQLPEAGIAWTTALFVAQNLEHYRGRLSEALTKKQSA